jgi:hypothetical protein
VRQVGSRNDARREACGGIRRPQLRRGTARKRQVEERQAIEARWEGQVRCLPSSERDVAEWAAFDVSE